jgi:hypothetical protein
MKRLHPVPCVKRLYVKIAPSAIRDPKEDPRG